MEKSGAIGVVAYLIGDVVVELVRIANSTFCTKFFFGALFRCGELDPQNFFEILPNKERSVPKVIYGLVLAILRRVRALETRLFLSGLYPDLP